MGEIVNLRRARKRKERLRREVAATANRAAFGVPKAAKRQARAEHDLVERRLDDHCLADSDDSE